MGLEILTSDIFVMIVAVAPVSQIISTPSRWHCGIPTSQSTALIVEFSTIDTGVFSVRKARISRTEARGGGMFSAFFFNAAWCSRESGSGKPAYSSLPVVRIRRLNAVGGLFSKLIFSRALCRKAARRCGFVVGRKCVPECHTHNPDLQRELLRTAGDWR